MNAASGGAVPLEAHQHAHQRPPRPVAVVVGGVVVRDQLAARAVLDELERVGAVRRRDDDRIELVTDAYIPAGDEAQKLLILGKDAGLLLDTIAHNLTAPGDDARFQRKLAYDNLPREALPAFRQLSAEKAQALLEELDQVLSRQDRDENPDAEGTGRMEAGIGIYYFENAIDRNET